MRDDNEAIWRSYARALRARNRSEKTIRCYWIAVTELDAHSSRDLSEVSRADVEDYLSTRLTQVAATTVAINFRSLRAFFSWMQSEEIIDLSPMKGLVEPKVPDNPPEVLSEGELKQLLAACSGKGFESRRDEAIIRVFSESGGPRLGEISGMLFEGSLDLTHDLIKVTGKGNKTRLIPFGVKTGTALDRYLRLRQKHAHRASEGLWIGRKGRLTPSAFEQMLDRRAEASGIGKKIYPHMLRHTSAHRWYANGGSDQDAMMLFGWSSLDMPRRYGRQQATARAHSASRRVSLGDKI